VGANADPGEGVSVPPKITLLCLLSSPHSGSTILGATLAAHPDVVYAGELFEIPTPAWIPGRPCACGLSSLECPFWSGVRRHVEGVGPLPRFAEDEARYGRWSTLLRWWLGGQWPSRRVDEYTSYLDAMVRGIAAESGRRIVIDSSKVLSRALAYERLQSDDFDVRFIHLVRDGQEVLASRSERRTRTAGPAEVVDRRLDAIQFSGRWIGANLLIAALLGRRKGRYLRLRYEDFLADPEAALDRVGPFLGVELSAVGQEVAAGRPIPVGHIVAGNRLRQDGAIVVRRTPSSNGQKLRPGERRTFSWIAGPAAHIFGYR
jgi:hypothetical protein